MLAAPIPARRSALLLPHCSYAVQWPSSMSCCVICPFTLTTLTVMLRAVSSGWRVHTPDHPDACSVRLHHFAPLAQSITTPLLSDLREYDAPLMVDANMALSAYSSAIISARGTVWVMAWRPPDCPWRKRRSKVSCAQPHPHRRSLGSSQYLPPDPSK